MAYTLDPYLTVMYNGLTSPQDFRRHFELHSAVNKWDDAAQLKYLPLVLVDKAKRAYDSMQQKNNIKTVLDELETSCALSKEVALQQFYHAKRDTNESLSKYASRLQGLLNVAQPGTIESQLPILKVKLSDGLPESVRLVFTVNSSMTWDEIVNALNRLDPMVSSSSIMLENQVRGSNIIKQEPMDVNYIQSRGDKFQGRCHFCNKVGHKWSNCGLRVNSNDSSMNSSVSSNQSYNSNNSNNYGGGYNNGYHGNGYSNDNRANRQHSRSNNNNDNQLRNANQRMHQFNGGQNQNYGNSVNNRQQNQNRSFGVHSSFNNTSFDGTMGHPMANSTFMSQEDNDARSDHGANDQANYLLAQNNLLKNQLAEMQNQMARLQNSINDSNVTNSSQKFIQTSQSAHAVQTPSSDCVDAAFPFHAFSMSHTTSPIPAVLSVNGDSLLRLEVKLLVEGITLSSHALIDGGSTHSFVNPRILSTEQLEEFENNKHKYEERLFIITSATGIVRESCRLVTCVVSFGSWIGEIKLVVSKLLDKNSMVIGRDFLRRYKVKVDHGNDLLEIEQHRIFVNSVVSNSVSKTQVQCPNNEARRCLVKQKRVLEPNTHNLVEVYFEQGSDESGSIVFEPVSSGSRGCLVAKSLHHANGTVQYADVMNTSDLPVTLVKDLHLGNIFSCDVPSVDPASLSHLGLSDDVLKARIDRVLGLKFGSKMSAAEKSKMIALLVKYYSVFQWANDPPGRTHVVEHRIDTGDARPVTQKQYPIPSIAKNALLDQVKDMLSQGIIRESNSPWRSPVLLIKKTDDTGAIIFLCSVYTIYQSWRPKAYIKGFCLFLFA
jgi:hypothetical protein